MATLEAAIDARKAKIGAASFKSSTKVMERAALSVDRTVDRIDRRMKAWGRSAKGFSSDTQQIAKSSMSMQRSLYRMERRMQTMVRSSDRLRKSTRATGAQIGATGLQINKAFGPRASAGVRGFQNAIGAIGIAFTSGQIVRGIVNMTKELQDLQNRLRLVTDGSSDLADVQSKLADISVRTRSDLAANANLYARLVINTKDLNVTQEELLLVTENINKANIISGATSREASNALVQLSQGLASNTLRGDELRSVMEQLPVVAEKIAEELGVSRGEMRRLAEEGKVNAETIINAFNKVDEDLNARFAKTTETIGQTMGMIHNEAVLIVGELGKFALPIAFMQDVRESLTEFRKMLEIINKVKIQNELLSPTGKQETMLELLRERANARAATMGLTEEFGKEIFDAAFQAQRTGSLLRPENIPPEPAKTIPKPMFKPRYDPSPGANVASYFQYLAELKQWEKDVKKARDEQQRFFARQAEQTRKDVRAMQVWIDRIVPDARHAGMRPEGLVFGPPIPEKLTPRGYDEAVFDTELMGPPAPKAEDLATERAERWQTRANAVRGEWTWIGEINEKAKQEEARERERRAIEHSKTSLHGLIEFQKEAAHATTNSSLAYSAASASAQALGDSLYDLATGTASVSDAFKNMARSIVNSMARIISEMIALKAISGIATITGFTGLLSSAPAAAAAPAAGGYVGAGILDAHSGGTFSGPTTGYPVRLHGTERVIPLNSVTKEPLGSDTGGNTTIVNNTFNVVATDAQSFDERFRDSVFRNSRFVGEAVYGETSRNPQLQGRI